MISIVKKKLSLAAQGKVGNSFSMHKNLKKSSGTPMGQPF